MISLGTTQKIQVITSGDGGEQIDVLTAWVDTADDLPASAETNITSATTTDVVASPSSGLRQVDLINIRNKDTASCDVTVQQVNSSGSKTVQLIKVSLPAGFTLQFSSAGWQIVNPSNIVGASFMAQQGTDQEISGEPDMVEFPTEVIDTHGWFASNRFTPLRAGRYHFSAGLVFGTHVTDQKYYTLYIRKNRSAAGADNIMALDIASGNAYCGITANGLFDMNGSTDFVEVWSINETYYDVPAVHPHLFANPSYNYFCGHWVGD